jgi:hypothetical protein
MQAKAAATCRPKQQQHAGQSVAQQQFPAQRRPRCSQTTACERGGCCGTYTAHSTSSLTQPHPFLVCATYLSRCPSIFERISVAQPSSAPPGAGKTCDTLPQVPRSALTTTNSSVCLTAAPQSLTQQLNHQSQHNTTAALVTLVTLQPTAYPFTTLVNFSSYSQSPT